MNPLLDTLRHIVGASGLLVGAEVHARSAGIWRSDNLAADILVRPVSTDQVASIMAACNEAEQPVVTHGGLTGLVHGTDTRPGDLVLSLERMKAIQEIDAANRTMTVQAGAILQQVHEAAEAEGLMFPLDLGARGSCTIGGNVSTNAGGTQVIRYGMARDQVLGLEAVLADGTVLSSMNQMIKNNAGYDLKQLFMGTEGTLGVITRLVLRLRERPGSEQTALVACDSMDAVTRLLKYVDAGLGGQLSGFEVMWREYYELVTQSERPVVAPLPAGHAHYVLIESMGSDPATDQLRFETVLGEAMEEGLIEDAVIASSGKDRDMLWAVRDDVEQTLDHGPAITFDVSLRIPDMERYVAQVRERLRADWGDNHRCWVFGHLGDGNLHVVVAAGDDGPETRRRVESAAYGPLERIGGSVSAEHGIGLEKKPWLHLSRSAQELDLMRRLKRAMDPKGILNPGKVFDPAH